MCSITVSVDADTRDWIVVYRDNNGKPNIPAIIGKTWIDAGINNNIQISFGDSTVTDGKKLSSMVHYEKALWTNASLTEPARC